jgi:predicted nucleic acid-binding protein
VSRPFLDTNVLVYADDADAGTKRATAQELLEGVLTTGDGVLSTQVLQEYFVVATRKLGVPPEVAQRRVELYASLTVIVIQVEHIVQAIKLHRLHQLSFWDALVVHAASLAGCSQLLSEDLQEGRVLEGVEVVNPFRASRLSDSASSGYQRPSGK